jgi:Clp amino terminal domain, pathogenicity island component
MPRVPLGKERGGRLDVLVCEGDDLRSGHGGTLAGCDDGRVFERFTERARQVVVFAQDEARLLKHNYIGTEHLLLGLMREEEGLAARALEAMNVSIDEVRDQVGRLVGEGDEVTTGQIPFTPRAKKVLELSLREALALTHNYIGTEHILLGLARENEGVAARILLGFGLDAERIRNEVVGMLSGEPAPQPPPRPGWRRPKRWRYVVEELGALETNAELVRLGADGWELVAVVGEPGSYRGVFMRPG